MSKLAFKSVKRTPNCRGRRVHFFACFPEVEISCKPDVEPKTGNIHVDKVTSTRTLVTIIENAAQIVSVYNTDTNEQ